MVAQQGLRIVGGEPAYPRRHPRVRVLLSAKLITTTEEIDVKVRDLSLGGAMLQGRSLPKVGSDVMLSRGLFEAFARVVWHRGDMCGVEFDDPLAALEDIHQGSVAGDNLVPLSPPLQNPPLLGPVRLTAAEVEAARAWAHPAGRQAFLD